MAFTRDELTQYEEKTQTQVDDNVSPFTGEPAAATQALSTDDGTHPSGAADPNAGQDDLGDGASGTDETSPDSSSGTAAAPSGETDPAAQAAHQQQPRKGSAAERIQELVGERDDYKAYGEYAQEQIRNRDQRIQELEAQVTAHAATPAAKVEPEEPFPAPEDPDVNYDSDLYKRKVAAWAAKKVEREKTAATAASPSPAADTPQQKVQRELQTFLGRVQKYAIDNKDFEEVTKALPQLAAPAARAVVLGEDGPQILYYLGKHKAEAVRIARLSPEEQLMELGAVRSKLPKPSGDPVIPPTSTTSAPGATQTQAKPKAPSSAPNPPTRVPAGGTRTGPDITDPNLSMAEFARLHREGRVQRRTQARQARGLR